MADTISDDFVNGSSFFGFMGVTMALVLASNTLFTQIWALLTEQLRRAQVLVALLFGGLPSS